MKTRYIVTGMTCAACSSRVEKAVSKLNGVNKVSVNLLKNTMVVDYNDNISSTDIINTVVDAGYGAYIDDKKFDKNKTVTYVDNEYGSMKLRVIWSFVFLIPLFYISMGSMLGIKVPSIFLGTQNAMIYGLTQLLLVIPIIFINYKYFYLGFKNLFKASPNMDSLIAIGSSASFIYGVYAIYKIAFGQGHNDIHMVHMFSHELYFEGAGTILTLITLGKFLEARAKNKTSDAINKLLDLAPKTARILRDGKEEIIPADSVKVGDIIIVKSGETIPVDGIVIYGEAVVDESAITGESIYATKIIGSEVIGATIARGGYIKMQAKKVGEDTTLAQIIKLVDESTASKAPIAKIADKVAGIFVPVVIVIAVVSALMWLLFGASIEFALSILISVLVVSCPCALGLATPTAIMVGTGRGATNGILIKSADILELAHKINTVVLDKTGTITMGKAMLSDIIHSDAINEDKMLSIMASIEKLSEHNLAKAIVEEAEKRKLELLDVKDFKQIAGAGISAIVDSKVCLIGNKKLMLDNSIEIVQGISNISKLYDELANDGKTPLFFAYDNKLVGIVAIADVIKATSKQAVEKLKNMGIDVIMLTGDNEKTAHAIAKKVGITNVVADILPKDKEEAVHNLQKDNKIVAMVGDGINDAPALARADVGIAIGAGTDIAMESADIVLMKSDLLDVVESIKLSKATIRNIKENLFWAFIYNIICIPVAAGCFYTTFGLKMNPMIASVAMSFSSVFVVSNALRLKFFGIKKIGDRDSVSKNQEINNIIIEETRKEDNEMKKIITIEGMMCNHCVNNVTKVLSEVDGVTNVKVVLEEKKAYVDIDKEIDDEVLKNVIVKAGYEVIEIK